MILLTGGNGFLGLHLQEVLQDRPFLAPRSSELDLLDDKATKSYFEEHGITQVIHGAGFVGGIGLNKSHPGKVASLNLRMGLNVLDAAAHLDNGCHVVIVSTICAYPQEAPVPTREESLYEGFPALDTAPYGLAKRELHSLAGGLSQEFNMSYTYCIPTNLYGPGDHFDEAKSHVVPALMRRALQAKERGDSEIAIWGDGTATRDFLYVGDAARALVLALDADKTKGEVVNLGSNYETSVKELAETILDLVEFPGQLVWDPTKPTGAPRRGLDGSKAAALMGFRAEVNLRQGLERTLAWYLPQFEQEMEQSR